MPLPPAMPALGRSSGVPAPERWGRAAEPGTERPRGQLCPGPERKELGWPRPSQGALGTRGASGPEPRTGTASPPCPPRRLCRLCPGKRSRLPDRGSLPRKAGGKREIPSCTEPCKWRRVLAGSQRPRPQPLVSKGHVPEAAALFWKCQLGCPVLSCPLCGLGKQRQQSLPAAPQPQPGSKGSTEEQAGSECPDPAPSASWTAPREGNGEKLPGKLSEVRMSRCIPVMRQSTEKALPLSLNSSTFPGDPAPRSCTGGRRGQVPTVTKQRQQGSV